MNEDVKIYLDLIREAEDPEVAHAEIERIFPGARDALYRQAVEEGFHNKRRPTNSSAVNMRVAVELWLEHHLNPPVPLVTLTEDQFRANPGQVAELSLTARVEVRDAAGKLLASADRPRARIWS